MKKGDRVKVEDGELVIVGDIARNQRGRPYPFQVNVDLEASTVNGQPLDDAHRAYYEDHYAGPYAADQLVKV